MSGLKNTFKRVMSFSKGSGYETHAESAARRGGGPFEGSEQYTGIRVPGPGRDRSQPQMTTNQGRRAGRTMARNLGAPKRNLGATTVLTQRY